MIQAIFHWHSFVEIFDSQTNHSILIDPYITQNPKCDLTRQNIIDNPENKTYSIVLTHWHNDHLWDTIPLCELMDIQVVSTFELANYLKSQWVNDKITWMGIWGFHKFENFWIKFFQAIHWWEIWDWKSNFHCTPAWVIIYINWKKIYHAWDTALMLDMKMLENEKLDLAFLPIWDFYTMWAADALKAIEFIKSKTIVPIHYDTFPTIKVDSLEFAREVMLAGFSTPKLLSPGQAVILE